ncbi:hypothetical protein TNCT_307361 [Trichonephila clavata]|uniref:Uncharacterized protein n=1 Tax=Trichonephila clavata TaxID=2740835 RepID=A0A8X6FQH6_TRICU|nr:hypothetical protein TNCT_307361 [Trichonephila clavata]
MKDSPNLKVIYSAEHVTPLIYWSFLEICDHSLTGMPRLPPKLEVLKMIAGPVRKFLENYSLNFCGRAKRSTVDGGRDELRIEGDARPPVVDVCFHYRWCPYHLTEVEFIKSTDLMWILPRGSKSSLEGTKIVNHDMFNRKGKLQVKGNMRNSLALSIEREASLNISE